MRNIAGLALVLLGLIFLATNFDWIDYSIGDLFADFWPVILIVVGGGMIWEQMCSRSGRSSVLHDLSTGKKFSKAFGDAHMKPKSIPAEGLKVSMGLGDTILDLSETELHAGINQVECSMGAGDVKVIVPKDIPLKARCSVGAGDVYLLGRHEDGLSPSLEHQDETYESAEKKINLSVRIGLGDVKVSYP